MTVQIIKTRVAAFLKEHLRGDSSILVGFSGGGDSLALVHLLEELQVPMHLAHFDHGWREESQREADELRIWSHQRGIPFSAQRWENPQDSELAARNARYAFFESLFQRTPFQAIALAHHADDQAETVLKRLLEGAHFHNFRAMQPTGMRNSIPIWRPLLRVSKRDILFYLKEIGSKYIEDPTNVDLKYLRARLREEIVPYLSDRFGKNIAAPLARLSEYGDQLTEYLAQKTSERSLKMGPRGPYYDFRGAHPVEIDFVLSRSPFPTPSHHLLKKIHNAVQENSCDQLISDDLLVDRGIVYWIKKGERLVN